MAKCDRCGAGQGRAPSKAKSLHGKPGREMKKNSSGLNSTSNASEDGSWQTANNGFSHRYTNY